ncbi:M20/M25/M40 family metallo-hydrolase [Elioraea rosea]|uniref:M20/M25/M40 family metallo-hydrolase n=1 Tax=Elioraea rosea TaxID=2492390 RepID=UPI001181ECC8|nr:M20/M25/M40 family metallo-hydrolase [Elioraea rosea]
MDTLSRDLLASLEAEQEASIAFLQALLRAPSPNPPGDTRAAAALLIEALTKAGLEPKLFSPQPEMPNIVAHFDGARPGRHLVLNGHIDVFPVAAHEWSRDPWGGEIAEGRIYGRGACDMKGGLASLLLAFLHLHRHRDKLAGRVTFTAVSDEETFGPWGARWMFEHQRELMMGDCLLSGEPSSPQCVRFGEKSPYWVAITVRTKGGHGAYTHSSASATKIAARIATALEEVRGLEVRAPDNVVAMFRDPAIARQIDEGCGAGHAAVIPEITLNIGRMSGGLKMNVLPSECRIEADVRLPIGLSREAVRAEVARIVARFPEATLEEISPPEDVPNWSDPDGEMMGILRRTVQELGRPAPVPVITLGGTDTRLWRYHGVPAYVYGPSPASMGAADENIALDDFLHILRTHTLAAARYLTNGKA